MESFLIVWADKTPGRAWILLESTKTPIYTSYGRAEQSAHAVITDSAELEEALSHGDSRRYAAPPSVVHEVLGWDV